jgi:UDP-N-acetylglucosamine--N-acetylmuramyl-(pentapeptide) pyrophosphoryl-undecaprenol N-acetylglucosamine transferase
MTNNLLTNSPRKKHIVFTGGGTAGHVTPNIALIEALDAATWTVDYIGSEQGVEQSIIGALQIPYHAIKTGKLRRYFSWKNVFSPFYVLYGIVQAFFLLRRLKTDIVFSKGGFVAFPVVFAAWLNRIPVIAHESDFTPGLANRLCFPFVKTICVTFAAGKDFFKQSDKVVVTGTPIRRALFAGERDRGLSVCGFDATKPCLLVIGGSQGAHAINKAVREALPRLTQAFQVIHLCGKGKVDASLQGIPGYCQMEYADKELPDLFAASELVISRAGANSVYEILALQKLPVFIPLSAKVSRGDQIHNAAYFEKLGIGVVLDEDKLCASALMNAIGVVESGRSQMLVAIKALGITSATEVIIALIHRTILLGLQKADEA